MARRDEAPGGGDPRGGEPDPSEEGAAALTVRRIANEAGGSTMGIYSRFGGKDGVVDAALRRGLPLLCADIAETPLHGRAGGGSPVREPRVS